MSAGLDFFDLSSKREISPFALDSGSDDEVSIEALENFDEVLGKKEELSDLDSRIQVITQLLLNAISSKARIDKKVAEKDEYIKQLNSLLLNKSKTRKTSKKRRNYQIQIKQEKNVLKKLKEKSAIFELFIKNLRARQASVETEKSSLEKSKL